MIRDLQEIWNLLEVSSPATDQLRVREVTNIDLASGRVLLGMDVHRHRHLLIPVDRGIKIAADRQSSGVQIIAHPLVDREKLQSFVDLICLKPHLHELFSILVNEVLGLLQENSSRPDLICHRVLDRWRELLEHEPSNLLGIEKLVGLFGELWFLREIVQRYPKAVFYWTGPRGTRHDISTGALAVEVKSTLSRHGRFVEVHGHEQLESPENGKLYLVVIKLECVPALGESLPELVESIIQHGGDRYTLFSLLAQVDASLLKLDSYKDIRFRLYENRVYEVKDKFPRIVSGSFVNGVLPSGITKLTYQIDLSNEPPEALECSEVEKLFTELGSLINAL